MQIVGLSGVAKAGKDSFFKGLKQAYPEYTFNRLSVADYIRESLYDFIVIQTGIDIWHCSPKEKEMVRPLLAWYGDIKRKQTNGMYFLNKIDTSIKEIGSVCDYLVITDIRFREFQFDEPDWIHSHGGTVIHIERQLPDGSISQPANDLERLNDPKLRKCADLQVSWPTFLPTDQFEQKIAEFVKKTAPLCQKPFQTVRN